MNLQEQGAKFEEVFRRGNTLVAQLRAHGVLGGLFSFDPRKGKVVERNPPADMHQQLTQLMEESGCWNAREDCIDGLFWVYLQMMEWKLDPEGDGGAFTCTSLGCPRELVDEAALRTLEDLEIITYIMAKYGFNRENLQHLVNQPDAEGVAADQATEHIRRVFAESSLVELPVLEFSSSASLDSMEEAGDFPLSPLVRGSEGTAYLRLQRVLSQMNMDFVKDEEDEDEDM